MNLRVPVSLLGPLLKSANPTYRLPEHRLGDLREGMRMRIRGIHPAEDGQQPRLSKTVIDVVLEGWHMVPLEDVSGEDVAREGWPSLDVFLEAWVKRAHRPPKDRPEMAVVLSLRVVPSEDEPRLLTPAARPAHTELGYTSSRHAALADEPEAVDEVTQIRFSADAEARGRVMRAERELHERARSLGRRVREEALRTGRAGVDVGPELDRIDAVLAEIERKRGMAA